MLLVVVGLCADGLWLFSHDDGDFELRRNERLTALAVKRQEIRAALADVARRREDATTAMAAEAERARQAEKVIGSLHDLESTWDRLVGNPAQQKANAEQIKRMEEVRDAARAKSAEGKQSLARLAWEKDGLELDQGRLEREQAALEKDRSIAGHYFTAAWRRWQGWVLVGFAVYLVAEVAVEKRRRVSG
jgi:chromosome segregation ATPase